MVGSFGYINSLVLCIYYCFVLLLFVYYCFGYCRSRKETPQVPVTAQAPAVGTVLQEKTTETNYVPVGITTPLHISLQQSNNQLPQAGDADNYINVGNCYFGHILGHDEYCQPAMLIAGIVIFSLYFCSQVKPI